VNISWFIAKRIANAKHKSFSSFIVRLCIIATAISVAVMIVSTALFDGFEEAITQKFYSSWGNIQVMNYDASGSSFQLQSDLQIDSSFIRNLQSIKGVKAVCPYTIQNAIFRTKKNMQGALLKGIDQHFDWQRINQFIIKGKQIAFTKEYSRQILISNYQAEKLNLKIGDSMIAYFIQQQGDAPRARKLEICGIYETGLLENDKLFAFADTRLINHIRGDSIQTIFGYEVTVNKSADAKNIQRTMQENFVSAPLEAYLIEERFSYIFQWLHLIKSDLGIIYIIMLVVAVMNMMSGILILILERTQMIGILKSIGSKNSSIQSIFFWQSLYIASIGIALGIGIALVLGWLQQYYHIISLDPKVYYVQYVQVYFQAYKIVGIALGTMLVCALLLIIPTLLVHRIHPIKALRFD
jgi:lipoprotein-releasing system permease protein